MGRNGQTICRAHKQASKQASISLNNQHVKKEESLELHKPSR